MLKNPKLQDQRGYAFIAALLAMLILVSLGVLIFTLTTRDARITIKVMGEKKAMSAADDGIQWLLQNYDPANPKLPDYACASASGYYVVSASPADPTSCFQFSAPTAPTSGAPFLPAPGYSLTGGQRWGLQRLDTTITGTNTRFMSQVAVEVELGHGPVDSSTIYR